VLVVGARLSGVGAARRLVSADDALLTRRLSR
jgi:hypothetical protein